MKFDLVLGGVGGQGILSIASVIDNAAMQQGLTVKQAEVHGMAQRGGSVSSHLRLSDRIIHSDLIAEQSADLILSIEPMEALRYRPYLASTGLVITSSHPVENIPDYPPLDDVLAELCALPRTVLLNANRLARLAGSFRAENMVMLGAAAPYLPLEQDLMERYIRELFGRKGDKILQANVQAFQYGREGGQFFCACVACGMTGQRVLALLDHLDPATVSPAAAGAWCEVLTAPVGQSLQALMAADTSLCMAADVATAGRILSDGIAFLQENS